MKRTVCQHITFLMQADSSKLILAGIMSNLLHRLQDILPESKHILVCLIAASWCEWSTWADCESSNGRMVRERRRKCQCPPPQDGEQYCQGGSLSKEGNFYNENANLL